MLSDYELKGFETALQITTAIHVVKFLIVELKDLWIVIREVKSKSEGAGTPAPTGIQTA